MSPETSVAKYQSTLRNIAPVTAYSMAVHLALILHHKLQSQMLAGLSAVNLMGHGRTQSWSSLLWYSGTGMEVLKKTTKHLVEIIGVPAGNQS